MSLVVKVVSIPQTLGIDKRDGAEEAHRAHNPRVGGSKPSLATSFATSNSVFGFLGFRERPFERFSAITSRRAIDATILSLFDICEDPLFNLTLY